MKTGISYVFPLVIGFFGISHSSLALADVTSNVVIPLVATDFVSCANNGTGEIVDLTGNLHALFITNSSNSGNVTVKFHFNPQDVIAVGRTTGNIYQGTGVTQMIATYDGITCLDSWDHVPIRSWPLFKARNVLRTLLQSNLSLATR